MQSPSNKPSPTCLRFPWRPQRPVDSPERHYWFSCNSQLPSCSTGCLAPCLHAPTGANTGIAARRSGPQAPASLSGAKQPCRSRAFSSNHPDLPLPVSACQSSLLSSSVTCHTGWWCFLEFGALFLRQPLRISVVSLPLCQSILPPYRRSTLLQPRYIARSLFSSHHSLPPPTRQFAIRPLGKLRRQLQPTAPLYEPVRCRHHNSTWRHR